MAGGSRRGGCEPEWHQEKIERTHEVREGLAGGEFAMPRTEEKAGGLNRYLR